MSTSANEVIKPCATNVDVTADTINIELSDGRGISVPLSWYPRLEHASPDERKMWELLGSGLGIHWPEIDEDISIEALIVGKPSNESQDSLNKWLESRST